MAHSPYTRDLQLVLVSIFIPFFLSRPTHCSGESYHIFFLGLDVLFARWSIKEVRDGLPCLVNMSTMLGVAPDGLASTR